MPGCAAIGCINRSEKGYAMKCFPRNPALRTLWTERVCRADWLPSKNSFLCNVHFDADQWITLQNGRKKLKRNAVPSIFTVTSTRKSPRKRRRSSKNDVNKQNPYIIEYLEDSPNSLESIPRRTIFLNQLFSKFDLQRRFKKIMRNKNDKSQKSSVIGVNNVDELSTKNGRIREKIVVETNEESPQNRVKLEMKSRVESDQDTDDIERKLRWICEGEIQPEQRKVKTETTETTENGKSASNFDVKIISCSKQNGETNKKKIIGRNAKTKLRRSRYESVNDVGKLINVVDSINGIKKKEEKYEKTPENLTTPTSSMFTIKVTGMDEDVTEIVKTLGTEPIYKYKSETASSRNCKNFVTSVISVSDRSITKNYESSVETKPEIDEISRNDVETNWKKCEINYLDELSADSQLEDVANSLNLRQLRERVKFQNEIIRKLTKGSKIDENSVKTIKSSMNSKKNSEDSSVELTTKIHRLGESNRNLNKNLEEKNRQTKKLECQIRQRNNRIKELNWKLDKASKYVARAEKNAKNYRKKMFQMRAAIERRKNVEEMKSVEDSTIFVAEKAEKLTVNAKKRRMNEDRNEMKEEIVYRTVQDIFDESNNFDDDQSFIDSREEFMREFGGAL